MAKITGEQTIPSALREKYMGSLNEVYSDGRIGKRFPFRLPPMQEGGGKVRATQKAQRERFKEAIALFAGVDEATRERWFDAAPPISSFLWYYNYFIMSALNGNANIEQGGAGVIKSIQFKTISQPAGTGEGEVAITAVDINKAVVMLFGASVISREAEFWAQAITVYPYLSSMAAELVKTKWSIPSFSGTNTSAATISIIVIEYI
jgi:hypothetical protein